MPACGPQVVRIDKSLLVITEGFAVFIEDLGDYFIFWGLMTVNKTMQKESKAEHTRRTRGRVA